MYILLVIKRDTYILDWQFVSRLYQRSLTINSSLEEHRQMTRSQLILSVQSQKNVTKNRTDHRKHVEGPQICQINRWNKSVQNMYGMNRQQLTVWPGKLILCKKNTSKTAIFVCTNLSYLTLEGPRRQTVDTRSTSGVYAGDEFDKYVPLFSFKLNAAGGGVIF